jgi:hypothetical protein
MLRIVVASAGVFIGISSANAIQIAPECKGMRDQIGCTCAVQNGGQVVAKPGGGSRWFSRHGSSSQQTNEAFVKCQASARGR